MPYFSDDSDHFDAMATILGVFSHAGIKPVPPSAWQYINRLLRYVFRRNLDLNQLPHLSAKQLGRKLFQPQTKQDLLELLLVLPYVKGTYCPKTASRLEDYFDSLGVLTNELKKTRQLVAVHLQVARYQQLRVMPQLLTSLPIETENQRLMERYQCLKKLDSASLGKGLYNLYEQAEWPFPGSAHGPSSGLVVIGDLSTVLLGLAPNIKRALLLSAFQSGYAKNHSIAIAASALIDFVSPLRRKQKEAEISIKSMLHCNDYGKAQEIGQRMSYSLYDGWNYWNDARLSIENVREKYGIAAVKED